MGLALVLRVRNSTRERADGLPRHHAMLRMAIHHAERDGLEGRQGSKIKNK